MSIGAVTGLAAEARIARQVGLVAAAGGGRPDGTAAAIETLLSQGVRGLVSFGIAGALAPGLPSGALVLPGAVRDDEGAAHWVDLDWHGRLAAAARASRLPLTVGGMLGAAAAVGTAGEKAALHRETGAVAVDLESHRVAAAASRAKLPFVILRVIADAADRDLPPAALVRLRRNGQPDLVRVVVAIARSPGQIPALVRLSKETRAALDVLLKGARTLEAALLAG